MKVIPLIVLLAASCSCLSSDARHFNDKLELALATARGFACLPANVVNLHSIQAACPVQNPIIEENDLLCFAVSGCNFIK